MTGPRWWCLVAAAAALLAGPAAWAQTGSVCIDAGHGGDDPGAVGNGLNEKDLNLTAALAFRDWLALDTADGSSGGSWDVYMTRDTDVYVTLSGRCDYANSHGVDVFMSIHANAGGGNGTETYAYASGGSADDLAHEVQEEVLEHLGTNDRGVKYASFTVLTDTAMPADLNEMAFIDVWEGNAELLEDPDNLDAVGLGHLHAIQGYFGLSAYTPGDDPGGPTATVTFGDYPASAQVGDTLSVSVDYSTNLNELGERGYLEVMMLDADSWEELAQRTWDNEGDGIQGPAGSHEFSFVAPTGSDAVYFVTYLALLDDDWTDRLDDDSTQDDPTPIGAGPTPHMPDGLDDDEDDGGCSGCTHAGRIRAGQAGWVLLGLLLVARRQSVGGHRPRLR